MLPVFMREVGGVQGDTEFGAYRLGIGQVGGGGAVAGVVVLLPVFHKQPADFMPLLQEQRGGD